MAILKRILVGLLVIAALIALGLFGYAKYTGIWNIFFPSTHHDTKAPTITQDIPRPALLVFSKTNQFRHRESIEGGLIHFEALAKRRGWGFYATENGAVFNTDQLAMFDTVLFLNATGDMLSDTQEQAFQRWMESGGGWLGVHAAGDGSHKTWDWYMENFIGAPYVAHILGPQFQTATVVTEDQSHPVNRGIPSTWEHEEEWYSWASSPRETGFNILATVDENTYSPIQNWRGESNDLSMGDHPVVWSNCVGTGRSVYATMGHRASAFQQPQYQQILENALEWTLGVIADPRCSAPDATATE
jgi:type 1 glutamine amidotransferase